MSPQQLFPKCFSCITFLRLLFVAFNYFACGGTLKVLVALMLSFCWLLRNFKIKWAEDLRDNDWLSKMCFIELFGQLFFLWKVTDCHHFHRSGSGAVGAWAHIREALARLWWQGQWLYNLIYSNLLLQQTSFWLSFELENNFACFFCRYTMGARSSLMWTPRLLFILSQALL